MSMATGVPDFIVGKRYWSHLDTYLDPNPYGQPVLYVYKTVRNPKAPGGAEFCAGINRQSYRRGFRRARRRPE